MRRGPSRPPYHRKRRTLQRPGKRAGDLREDPSNAINAAQATQVVLQAIARTDGTRASVLRESRATDVKDGIPLRSLRDITSARIAILRVTGSSSPKPRPAEPLKGAVVVRVETIPASLTG